MAYLNRYRPVLYNGLIVTAVIVVLLSAWMQILFCASGDKDWELLATRMMLEGKTLYHDIFEIQPPLIFWIYSIPCFIALHTGIENGYLLGMLGLGVTALSIIVSTRLITLHPFFAGDKIKQTFFFLLLISTYIVCTSPSFFADREYLFLVLTFPYMLRFMPSLSDQTLPRGKRILIGIMAGIGFCIKPHCALVLGGLILLHYLRTRSLRRVFATENLIIAACVLLYIALIMFVTPDYIRIILPMALATYKGYANRLRGLMYGVIAFFTFAFTFIDFRVSDRSVLRGDILYFVSICVLLLLYALSNNGWGYTYGPLNNALLILNGLVLLEFFELKKLHQEQGLPYKKFLFGARSCIFNWAIHIIIAFTLLCYTFHEIQQDKHCQTTDKECPVNMSLVNIVHKYNAHSFGALSMDFLLWPLLVHETGAHMQTRFYHLWMLPRIVTSNNTFLQQNLWIPVYLGKAFTDDLQNNSPDIVFVDSGPYLFPTHERVDIPEFLGIYYAPFKDVWKQYHLAETVDKCSLSSDKFACSYDVYVRNSAKPTTSTAP